jgi:branched-chain amino acid transport system ATP-binding protein
VTTPAINCQGLAAGYAGVPVVRNVNLRIEEGEIVALLGANGAGKTTTLLAMSGVLKPLSGRVEAQGAEIPGGEPHRAARLGVCLVPDDRSVFHSLTARENLRLGTHGKPAAEVERTVIELFPALDGKLNRRAGLLSGGEQQMLALGRAVSMDPKVLLIDEMSLGLAPLIVKSMLDVVKRIAKDRGVALLLVEQHVDLALRYSDRAYVLARGEIALTGVSRELAKDRHLLESSYLGEEAIEEAIEEVQPSNNHAMTKREPAQ